MIDCHTVRSTNSILAAITLTDTILFVILAMEVELQAVNNFTGFFRQTVFLYQRHNCQFHRSQSSRQFQNHTAFTIFQLFFAIRRAHDAKEHTVNTDRSFDYVRSIRFVQFRIEVFDALAGELLMLRQVEVSTRVDTFHFFESERHQELNISSCICVVSQFIVVVITIACIAESKSFMPFQTDFFPFLEPVKFSSRFYKELHFHLFELTHTEDELTGNDLVTESLTNLCDTERNFHTTRFLYIEVVYKNTLCSFRTKINFHGSVGSRTHFSREHQIELTNFCPVLCTGDRAYDFFINNDLTQFFQITVVQSFSKTSVKCVTFCLMLQYTSVGRTELSLIKRFAESLGSFRYFFIDFIVILSQLIFDQHVSTITFLRVFIVNQRVIECVYVSGSLPDSRMHKDGRVDTDNVLVQQHHAVPPVFLDVIFQFNAHLTVVIHSA